MKRAKLHYFFEKQFGGMIVLYVCFLHSSAGFVLTCCLCDVRCLLYPLKWWLCPCLTDVWQRAVLQAAAVLRYDGDDSHPSGRLPHPPSLWHLCGPLPHPGEWHRALPQGGLQGGFSTDLQRGAPGCWLPDGENQSLPQGWNGVPEHLDALVFCSYRKFVFFFLCMTCSAGQCSVKINVFGQLWVVDFIFVAHSKMEASKQPTI